MEKEAPYKSPRAIEEEIRQYKIARFERQMLMVDRGELPRAIAIAALHEEFDNIVDLGEPHEEAV